MKPKTTYSKKEKKGLKVIVQDDNVQKAIKRLRRLVKDNGVMQSYYQHRYYVKPSVERARKRSVARFKAKLWQRQQELKNNE